MEASPFVLSLDPHSQEQCCHFYLQTGKWRLREESTLWAGKATSNPGHLFILLFIHWTPAFIKFPVCASLRRLLGMPRIMGTQLPQALVSVLAGLVSELHGTKFLPLFPTQALHTQWVPSKYLLHWAHPQRPEATELQEGFLLSVKCQRLRTTLLNS